MPETEVETFRTFLAGNLKVPGTLAFRYRAPCGPYQKHKCVRQKSTGEWRMKKCRPSSFSGHREVEKSGLEPDMDLYRDQLKGVQILLSNSQARKDRKVKQEQEEISRNHVQAF